jgi:LacI family transcriptional regulator
MKLSVRRMIERRVEGVAVMTFGMEDVLLADLKFRKIPLVFVDVGPPLPKISNIRVDYLQGLRQAIEHLATLGHQRIAFISGPLVLKSATARRNAFMQSMEEAGLTIHPEYLVEGDHTMEGGVTAMQTLLQLPVRPTAVVCSNDMTAIGVMHKSHERGLHVPKDISIVGFDDIRLSQFVIPALTTIQMSQSELARQAFDALFAEVQREIPSPTGSEYLLKTKLLVRDSTAIALAAET